MTAETKGDLPILPFADQAAWEAWLAREHATSAGLWLKIARQGAAHPSVTYGEAVDSALCYGWIDGQKAAYDEAFWLQRFTPRRPRSRWSRRNRDRALALIEAGRMKPAGRRAIEQAQKDGRWAAAYASQATADVPEDLQRRLDENPEARAFFASLDSRNRYAILYRIEAARRPATRARRIETFIAMLQARQTLY